MPAEVSKILAQLFAARNRRGWLNTRGQNKEIVTLLLDLAKQAEPVTVLSIQDFIFDADESVARAAWEALFSLLDRALSTDYLRLDDLRGTRHEWHSEKWWTLRPDDVPYLARFDESKAAVLGLMSQHHSGFVRQRAVQELDACTGRMAIPFLLLRVNDWVGQIREEAIAALRKQITAANVKSLVPYLPLVLRLLDCGRGQHQELVNAVIFLLLDDENAEHLERAFEESDRRSQRLLYGIAWDLPGEHQRRLLLSALMSTDPVIRLNASRQINTVLVDDERDHAMDRCLRDSSMPVRRVALLAIATQHPLGAEEMWSKSLLDAHRSVRELARFYLAKIGFANVAEVYRRGLSSGLNVATCLVGLSEAGTEQDVNLVRQYLKSPLPSVRRAAVTALAALDGESFVRDAALAALCDPSPRVAAAARDAMIDHTDAVDGEALLKTILESRRDSTARMGLLVVDALGKWRALPLLIRLSGSAAQEIAGHARRDAANWFSPPRVNRVFSSPGGHEKELLCRAITDTAAEQPSDFTQSLRDWLRPWLGVP